MPETPNQPNPWQMAHMGLEFAAAALVLGAIGFWVDYGLGSFPTGTLVGLVLGVVGGTYRFIREALLANRRDMKRYRAAHGGQSGQRRDERDAEPGSGASRTPDESDDQTEGQDQTAARDEPGPPDAGNEDSRP
jgi:F0F1-type ATP synthase assembly protein I